MTQEMLVELNTELGSPQAGLCKAAISFLFCFSVVFQFQLIGEYISECNCVFLMRIWFFNDCNKASQFLFQVVVCVCTIDNIP